MGWNHVFIAFCLLYNQRQRPPLQCVHTQSPSRVWLLVSPWTMPHQPPLSMEFSRQEYWSALLQGICLTQGLNPRLLHLLHCSSVQFSCSVVSDSLQPHEQQYTRPPCPSPTPGVRPNPSPLNRWCHPTISSSVIPFSSCPQSFPASGSFQMSQLFVSGGQSTGVSDSASVLAMDTQEWSLLGWTGWISLKSKGLSRVFSNTTVEEHQFFSAQHIL